jgi:hypothetical protein
METIKYGFGKRYANVIDITSKVVKISGENNNCFFNCILESVNDKITAEKLRKLVFNEVLYEWSAGNWEYFYTVMYQDSIDNKKDDIDCCSVSIKKLSRKFLQNILVNEPANTNVIQELANITRVVFFITTKLIEPNWTPIVPCSIKNKTTSVNFKGEIYMYLNKEHYDLISDETVDKIDLWLNLK